MTNPVISIVLATYNRRDILARTLLTLLNQEFQCTQYEIVLVVDGSSDGTLEMLHEAQAPNRLRVIEEPHMGPAVARRTALEYARGDIVLFTDDDIRLTPGVVKYHVEAHQHSGYPMMVRGPIHIAPESPSSLIAEATHAWYERHFATFDPGKNGVRLPDDFLIFANTSVPRRSIEQCGGMDCAIPFPQEGFELLLRLFKTGLPLRFEPRAQAFEVYSKTTWRSVSSDSGGLGRAEWVVSRKHPDYRVHSAFGGIAVGGAIRRELRKAVALHPGIPNSLANLCIWAGEKLQGTGPTRKLGTRALALRNRVEVLRSGIREAGSWEAMECTYGVRLPVLMYHHVGPRHRFAHQELTVEPQQFAEQMRWLMDHGYTTISPSDWLKWCRDGKPLPSKPVLLTFDDGYADIFDYALPVLHERKFGATVFVCTAMLGQMDRWNDSGPVKSVLRLANAEQIREWAALGIEFGSHARSHPDLTRLEQHNLGTEIVGSGLELQSITGTRPLSFAYPFGFCDPRVKTMVGENYALAFSVEDGMNTLRTDLHFLRRSMVQPCESLRGFSRRVKYGRNFTTERRRQLGWTLRRLWNGEASRSAIPVSTKA